MGEARHFLSWYTGRSGATGFMQLSIGDIDAYLEVRAPSLRRRSLKDVAERLRSLMPHLRSPRGLRDYAILLLLSTYGMRAGVSWH